MQKSVLAEVVRSLNRKEIRELNKWLASPAHNQRQDVIRLFDYLVKRLPEGNEQVEKENAWRAVFPKEPYDDAYLRQVMYFLMKAVEEYFIFREYTQETVRPLLSLANLYRLRHLDKPFRQTMEAARRAQESSPLRNSDYHLDRFYLEQEQYFYQAEQKRTGEINLQEVSDELDTAFIANKLRIACEMLAHQSVYKKADYDTGFLNTILKDAASITAILQKPGVAVYYYGYMALTDRSTDTHFDQLENLLFKYWDIFPTAEQRELYLLSLNYCIPRINSGDIRYTRKAHELHRQGLSRGILLEGNNISRATFGNAVSIAAKVGEFDWAENFINQYQQHLEEKQRHSTVHFNLSRLYFEKGDYDKAQILLREFEYDDMLFNIIAKTMLLKIYYHEGELDAFESLLESMRSYLQRKEALDTNRKVGYKNMISLMKKLLNLNPFSKPQREKLREQVVSTQPLMERDWLLSQVDAGARRK